MPPADAISTLMGPLFLEAGSVSYLPDSFNASTLRPLTKLSYCCASSVAGGSMSTR